MALLRSEHLIIVLDMDAGGHAAGSQAAERLPRVSVVMAVLNAEATLGAQLAALARQTYPGWWELVVADNGSTDASPAILARASDGFPGIRVIDASLRRGDAHARNCAERAASGEVIVCCDADDVVDPGWIEALVTRLQRCDVAGGVNDFTLLNSARVNSWHWTGSRAGPTGHIQFGGGNLGCWRRVWDGLGGWNENVTRHGDADFIFRAQDAGYLVEVAPEALVHVRRRSSLGALAQRSFPAGIGTSQIGRLHPNRFRGRRRALLPRLLVRSAFVLLAWPAAIVSPAVRGIWLRHAAFSAGILYDRLRLSSDDLFQRR